MIIVRIEHAVLNFENSSATLIRHSIVLSRVGHSAGDGAYEEL